MPDKYNPFRPNKLVAPGAFFGRVEELETIDHCLMQTKNGNPQHFLIIGERGIGKSSLMLCADFTARGKMRIRNGPSLNFLVVNLSLQEKDDYLALLKRLLAAFKHELAKEDSAKAFILNAWDFISGFEAMGVNFKSKENRLDDSELLLKLCDDFERTLLHFGETRDGIVILIDEADRASSDCGLGTFCKLVTEHMTRSGVDRLCFGLAGLPNVMDRLRESHESSPRIFKSMGLQPLEDNERQQVIDAAVIEANVKNGVSMIVTGDAKEMIADLSEGYPHFLQEFGYSAFEQDDNNLLDAEDVNRSLFRENGAFDQLGQRYFAQYYDAPDSNNYRLVLDTMANHLDDPVDRTTLIAERGLSANIIDNALRALKQKNIIAQASPKPGIYRLPTKSFAVWIKAKRRARSAVISR